MPKVDIPAGSALCEYAKTGRGACKKCDLYIKEDQLKIGAAVQSRFFDGVQLLWYHPKCFFKTRNAALILTESNLFEFSTLRWKDQENVRKLIQENNGRFTGSARGRLEGLRVEYAKSGKSKCRGCENDIAKGLVRLSFLMDNGGPYGPIPAWHHVECFLEHHPTKCQSVEDFEGWKGLADDDIQLLKDQFSNINNGDNKVKVGTDQVKADSSDTQKYQNANLIKDQSKDLQNMLKVQNEVMWKVKDILKKALSKAGLQMVLQHNGLENLSGSFQGLVDRVTDILCFGVPQQCPECGHNCLEYDAHTQQYRCHHHDAWSACSHLMPVSLINLHKAKLPEEVLKLVSFDNLTLPIERIIVDNSSTQSVQVKVVTLDENVERKPSERNGDRSRKVLVKGSTIVDVDSGLHESHHILKSDGVVYASVLASSDVQSNKNTFYIVQALEGDWVGNLEQSKKRKRGGQGSASYYLYKKWGRVGTDIGGDSLLTCSSKDEAIDLFKTVYFEKTGNEFQSEIAFEKKPRKMFPLDLAVPESKDIQLNTQIEPGTKSKLPKSVQSLMKMIFDIDALKRTLIEMEIDLDRMPLGMISQRQISQCYELLASALDNVQSASPKKSVIQQCTNQFYTLIPHTFTGRPPLLDNEQIIKTKLDLLDQLREIEVATKMMKVNASAQLQDSDKDPLDIQFELLNAKIQPMRKSSQEFKLIKQSLETTHAPTHSEYKLQLLDAYEIERAEERSRYDVLLSSSPDMASNRRMLWHGSRTSNFVGILSEGLRIAPPEAPSTGYMFGKGVYFADMVSKSANYCSCSPDNDEGLLILSEVALGESLELTESQYIERLPGGKHSVKGIGKTAPLSSVKFKSVTQISNASEINTNGLPKVEEVKQLRRSTRNVKSFAHQESSKPAEKASQEFKQYVTTEVDCPVGPPVENNELAESELLYNEYIVYKVDQILMRYIVKVKFVFDDAKRQE
ncbi:hypothetical protein MIR68_007610 [Amoeboaphelidium protococcarum]|nr:hypothetical protein MIR68_007610 [Amoeboaphelidium protococcarum]